MTAARPTLDSVAREAGVSRQTVSNVVNSPQVVAAPTLARVQEAITRLGYRPHEAARRLKTGRSQVIGLRIQPVVDGVNGVVLDLFWHAITESAQRLGYRVMLFTAPDDDAEIGEYEALVAGHGLDAFVLTATHHQDPRTRWLLRRGVPFVTFGRPWDVADTGSPMAQHSWVDVDGAAGTRLAVDALVADGHRRIAFLGWPKGSGAGDDRRSGWLQGLRAHGLPAAGLSAAAEDGADTGAAIAETLLRKGNLSPTAFVCASDSLALGALRQVRERGLQPGSGFGVIGFDDTPAASAVGLSSVAQPIAAVAANCLELLDSQLRNESGRPDPPAQRLLAPHLSLRASGGRRPPPAEPEPPEPPEPPARLRKRHRPVPSTPATASIPATTRTSRTQPRSTR